MKVQTNAGEIELTAEMVRRGMVFENRYGGRATYVFDVGGVFAREWTDGVYVALLGCDPAIAAREDCERYGIAPGIDAGAHGFARLRGGGAVDLRRHENVRPGMGFRSDHGQVTWWDAATLANPNWPATWTEFGLRWRFVGLSAHHARPGDVERLCCGAQGPVGRTADGTPVMSLRGPRCTLAIGHDGEHEDIATGVRWGGAASDEYTTDASRAAPWYKQSIGDVFQPPSPAVDTPLPIPRDLTPPRGTSAPSGQLGDAEHDAKLCRDRGWWAICSGNGTGWRPVPAGTPGAIEDVNRLAYLRQTGTDDYYDNAHFNPWINDPAERARYAPPGAIGRSSCDARCVGRGATEGAMHQEICPNMLRRRAEERSADVLEQAREARKVLEDRRDAETDESLRARYAHAMPPARVFSVRGADSGIVAAARALTAPMGWDGVRTDVPIGTLSARRPYALAPDPVAARLASEAPLVALVNAVPEGLDARGWTAAVLAYCEQGAKYREALLSSEGMQRDLATALWTVHDLVAHGRPWIAFNYGSACAAYHRAVAPAGPRPEPERRRGGRDVRLVVDDGRDDG